MKKWSVLFWFFTASVSLMGQVAGDIAVVGMNIDGGNDQFTIVCLADIPASTPIYFSDKRYYNGSLFNIGNLEGTFIWTPSSTVAAGTVIRFSASPASSSWSATPNLGSIVLSGSSWTSSSSTGSPFNDNNGENILIFTGGESSPSFIYGFLSSISPSTSVGSQPTNDYWHVGANTGPQICNLPPGLTNANNSSGTIIATALAFTGSLHKDDLVYNGPTTGTKDDILKEIGDKNNWLKRDNNPYDIAPGGSVFMGSNPIFTLSSACSMTASITSQSNVSCNGSNDGSLTITASSGTANYDYTWSNTASTNGSSSSSNTIAGLVASTYTVTVTDNNGCTATATATITEPAALSGGSISH